MTTVITREIARTVRDIVDAGLSSGLGKQEPGQMCVEAAVCYALGLPHGDDPGCVAQSLRLLKIRLNDALWSSKAARAAGLRRLAIAQLGSAGVLDEQEFTRRVVDVTIRKAVPQGLRAAAKVNSTHAQALEDAATQCEREGTREACRDARVVARAAAAAEAVSAAGYAAEAAAAAGAADEAVSAAEAGYAAGYAAAAAAGAEAGDKSLAEYTEWVVGILIDMQAPGCEWLDLVPREEAA